MNDERVHDISGDMEGGENDLFLKQLMDNPNACITL